MRRAARVDDNQPEIVRELRSIGATVEPLHAVGGGCPDLLVGYRGHNILIEVKDGSKKPSAQKLTPDQKEWHGKWLGQKVVINSTELAIAYVREYATSTEGASPESMRGP